MPIINIMLPVCATALNVNIQVWKNDNGFKNLLQFDVHPIPSTKTIHLPYTRTLNSQGIPNPLLDPNNLCHHYDALVLKGNDQDRIGEFLQMNNKGKQLQPLPASQAVVYSHILKISNMKQKMFHCIMLCTMPRSQISTTLSNKTCHFLIM